jgi:hypothetical protein
MPKSRSDLADENQWASGLHVICCVDVQTLYLPTDLMRDLRALPADHRKTSNLLGRELINSRPVATQNQTIVREMTQLNQCQCQSGAHGHKPGECNGQPDQSDKLCKACHDEAALEATAAIQPLSVKEADEKQTCRKTSPATMSIRRKTSFGAIRRSSFFKSSPATARNALPLLAFCFSIRRWIEGSILSASFFAASRHSTRFLQDDRRIGAERQ